MVENEERPVFCLGLCGCPVLCPQYVLIMSCLVPCHVQMRECEVKRLRLELQMAHIGAILQQRKDTAKKIRESHNYDADRPDVLLDPTGRNDTHNSSRSHRSYHRSKSDQTVHLMSPVHTKHQPATGSGYTPNGHSPAFHISELDSTEEYKSAPYSNGQSVSQRIDTAREIPSARVLTKDDALRDKTKLMMSLAGTLLHSEYAKDSSLKFVEVSSDEEEEEEGEKEEDEDAGDERQEASITDDGSTGRMSPLQKAIHEAGNKQKHAKKPTVNGLGNGQGNGQGNGKQSPGQFRAKRKEKKKKEEEVIVTTAVSTPMTALTTSADEEEEEEEEEEEGDEDNRDVVNKDGISKPFGRQAALGSGFVANAITSESEANNNNKTKSKVAVAVKDKAKDKVKVKETTQDKNPNKQTNKDSKREDGRVLEQQLPRSPTPLTVVYDQDGRKLLRTKSGTLIPSREFTRIPQRKSAMGTGRYSIDGSFSRLAKGSLSRGAADTTLLASPKGLMSGAKVVPT